MERYRPVDKTAVLLSFLGYSSVCAGYVYELGLPWRFWHPLVYWNFHSVLFDVSMCVMCYTTVLALEFLPSLVEKLPFPRLHEFFERWHDRFAITLAFAGTLLSSMHQSYLGGLFLIAKQRVYPLWYSPYLTTMFFLSAIPAGIAMLIIALYLCVRSLNAKIEFSVLEELSRVMALMLTIYTVFRALDILRQGAFRYVFAPRVETLYFWLEIALLLIIPLALLSQAKIRNNPQALYWTCVIV